MAVVLAVAIALICVCRLVGWMGSMARGGRRGFASRHAVASASERTTVELLRSSRCRTSRTPPTTMLRMSRCTAFSEGRKVVSEVTASDRRREDGAPDVPPAAVNNGPLLPPIEIFAASPKGDGRCRSTWSTSRSGSRRRLPSFNVGARVVDHHVGPVVTQFDILPERGVKVKSITALQNDLALALAAPHCAFRRRARESRWWGSRSRTRRRRWSRSATCWRARSIGRCKSPLKVVLGKDVSGNPAVIDLAKMPHLLIAGATGSGKSVCVNALISCLLYNNTPDEVRLMMVDPKMVELTVFNGVPHLLSPVVTRHGQGCAACCKWAVREMERRYQIFERRCVRNIGRLQRKDGGGRRRTTLPYIVIVIDELADLMMAAPEDVEDAICRLAQMARAAASICGRHAAPFGRHRHRPDQGQLPGAYRLRHDLAGRLAHHPRLGGRREAAGPGRHALSAARCAQAGAPAGRQRDRRRDRAAWWSSGIASPSEAVQRINEAEFEAAEKAASDAGRRAAERRHGSGARVPARVGLAAPAPAGIGYSRAARIMDQLEERGIVGAGGRQQTTARARLTAMATAGTGDD